MEEARDNSSMGFGKRQEQEGCYSGSTKRHKESPLCCTDGHICHLKNAELEPKLQKNTKAETIRLKINSNDFGGSWN